MALQLEDFKTEFTFNIKRDSVQYTFIPKKKRNVSFDFPKNYLGIIELNGVVQGNLCMDNNNSIVFFESKISMMLLAPFILSNYEKTKPLDANAFTTAC